MVDVEVLYRTSLAVTASPEEAFALVADIARSGKHFPGLDRLEPQGPAGRWTWRMRERGLGPIAFRVVYDAVYSIDESTRTVRWAPPGRSGGDMDSFGSWTVVAREGGATLHFEARTVAHVPAPRLMAKVVESIAKEELTRLKSQYAAAIQQTLGAA
jgi:carbon monoxide dehydrogenase subunit G